MTGRTAMVDPSGFLYIQNPDGSRTYLTRTLAGRTVNTNGGNNAGLSVDGSGTSSLIYRDDQGTFIMDPNGVKKYLTLTASTPPNKPTETHPVLITLFSRTPTATDTPRNTDGNRNYLKCYTSNPLDTFIVKMDQNGNEYFVYSDSAGNKYVVYDDARGDKYYLNTDSSKKYFSGSSPLNGINPALIEPGVEYKLYTDASGNKYI